MEFGKYVTPIFEYIRADGTRGNVVEDLSLIDLSFGKKYKVNRVTERERVRLIGVVNDAGTLQDYNPAWFRETEPPKTPQIEPREPLAEMVQ